MPIGRLNEIMHQRPSGRLMGLDLGSKTIGIALSDPMQRQATPLKTLHRKKFTKDIQELHKIITEYQVCGYVLGYPLNMDGSEGARCQASRHFAQEMLNHEEVFGDNPWIGLWDERLSTQAVDEFLVKSVDMSRAKRAQVIDALAAHHFLKEALDYINTQL